LLCLVLTLALAWWLSPGGFDNHIETHEHDRVSQGENAAGGVWVARGIPRLVKRTVGDQLAIPPSIPVVLALAPNRPWTADDDEPRPRSACRHQGASVRGPPHG
jgi:hypothetical protein